MPINDINTFYESRTPRNRQKESFMCNKSDTSKEYNPPQYQQPNPNYKIVSFNVSPEPEFFEFLRSCNRSSQGRDSIRPVPEPVWLDPHEFTSSEDSLYFDTENEYYMSDEFIPYDQLNQFDRPYLTVQSNHSQFYEPSYRNTSLNFIQSPGLSGHDESPMRTSWKTKTRQLNRDPVWLSQRHQFQYRCPEFLQFSDPHENVKYEQYGWRNQSIQPEVWAQSNQSQQLEPQYSNSGLQIPGFLRLVDSQYEGTSRPINEPIWFSQPYQHELQNFEEFESTDLDDEDQQDTSTWHQYTPYQPIQYHQQIPYQPNQYQRFNHRQDVEMQYKFPYQFETFPQTGSQNYRHTPIAHGHGTPNTMYNFSGAPTHSPPRTTSTAPPAPFSPRFKTFTQPYQTPSRSKRAWSASTRPPWRP